MKTTVKEYVYNKLGEKCIKLDHKSGLKLRYIPKEMSNTYCLISAPCGGSDRVIEYLDLSNGHNTSSIEEYPLGMAHFLEHKLFANADGEDTCEKLGKIGAYANAYTGYTSTVYLFSASENIEAGVKELVKSYFSPYFTNENVKMEKSIITEEIRMYADDPQDELFFALTRACFKNSCFHYSPCGSISSVKQITPQMLQSYHRAFYRPENTSLVICGRADIQKITDILNELLPGEGNTEIRIKKHISQEEAQVVRSRVTLRRMIPIPIFRIGIKFKLYSQAPEEYLKNELIISIITEHYLSEDNEFISGFYQRGEVTKQINFSWEMFDSENALIFLGGEAENANKIIRELKKYILSIPQCNMTQERLDTMKKVMYAQYIKMFDSTEQIANDYTAYLQSGCDFFSFKETLDSITTDDINQAANKLFKKESIAVAVMKPE